MKPSDDLIHTPIVKDGEQQKCLQCGHACHCGATCHARNCLCSRCVHDPDEVVDDPSEA